MLIEAPTASATRTALPNAAAVMIRRGRRSSSTIRTMRAAAASAAAHIDGELAATGVVPGRAMPSASATTCIELAVPMPGHTPGPPTAPSLISVSSSTVDLPQAWRKTSSMSQWPPRKQPLGW